MDNTDLTFVADFAVFFLVNFAWWSLMVAAVASGSISLHDCTIQPNIPIYLIVFGVTNLICLYLSIKIIGGSSSILTRCRSILLIFNFCWLIAGSVWIYSIYPPNYERGGASYCDETIYKLAFSITTMTWIFCACALIYIVYICILQAPSETSTTISTISILRISLYGATSDSADHAVGNV